MNCESSVPVMSPGDGGVSAPAKNRKDRNRSRRRATVAPLDEPDTAQEIENKPFLSIPDQTDDDPNEPPKYKKPRQT